MASSSGKRRRGLLDLDDDLLVRIVELMNDSTSTVWFGAVSMHCRAIHTLVTCINTSIRSINDELILLGLLNTLARNPKAHLQVLNASSSPGRIHHPEIKLDWIEPVAKTLQRLDLEHLFFLEQHELDPFFKLFARCTALVKLQLSDLTSRHAELLAAVVASCPSLELLSVSFVGECELDLVSSSLRDVRLDVRISATLDTPALAHLYISGFRLKILSHSLRSLGLDAPVNTGDFPVEISPPLANLEHLSFGDKLLAGHMREVMASIAGGCVDVLGLQPYETPIGNSFPMSLATLLQPLRRLRSLRIYDLDFLKIVTSNEASSTMTRLGVETLVLDMSVYKPVVLLKRLPRIEKFLSCLPAEKVIMDWGLATRAQRFENIRASLQSRFPGLTMVTR